MNRILTIFPSPSVEGKSFAASALALGNRLGYEAEISVGKDCLEFRLACCRSDAVLIDLSIEPGWQKMYGILVDEYSSLDHVLVVSRTYLPLNISPMRTGGAPPYPFPKESIPGFTWSNADMLFWVEEQLRLLSDVDAEPRIHKEIEITPDGDATFLVDKLIRMIRDSRQRQRREQAKVHQIFLSYRGNCYLQVRTLAERIRSGEWHSGKKVEVVLLTPGQLAFDRELLTEVRRWQILGMLEDLIKTSKEVWIYQTPDYFDSWWTIGELICTSYHNYAWEKDRSWTQGPRLRVYDPVTDTVSEDTTKAYTIPAGENLRRYMDRMLSIAHSDETDLTRLGSARILAKIYPFFYRLGLGWLFTRRLGYQVSDHQQKVQKFIPTEDQSDVAKMQREYFDYWTDPAELYFQLKNPLLQHQAWLRYAVERGEGALDPLTGKVCTSRFFDCDKRLRRAVPLARIAAAVRQPITLSDGRKLKVKMRPPRLLWEGVQEEGRGPELMEMGTFVGMEL